MKSAKNKGIRKWQKNNPDKVKEINQRYEKNNRKKRLLEMRNRDRKARLVKSENYRVDDDGNKIIRIKLKKFRRYKTRFAVLKRDNFTCQYCGRKAPEVILEVDHIYPKSKGGKNEIDNYKTSCRDCNIGKGVSILEIV